MLYEILPTKSHHEKSEHTMSGSLCKFLFSCLCLYAAFQSKLQKIRACSFTSNLSFYKSKLVKYSFDNTFVGERNVLTVIFISSFTASWTHPTKNSRKQTRIPSARFPWWWLCGGQYHFFKIPPWVMFLHTEPAHPQCNLHHPNSMHEENLASSFLCLTNSSESPSQSIE